jgi:hypothetical protein
MEFLSGYKCTNADTCSHTDVRFFDTECSFAVLGANLAKFTDCGRFANS